MVKYILRVEEVKRNGSARNETGTNQQDHRRLRERKPNALVLCALSQRKEGRVGEGGGSTDLTFGRPGQSRQASARCQQLGSRIGAAQSHSCRQSRGRRSDQYSYKEEVW